MEAIIKWPIPTNVTKVRSFFKVAHVGNIVFIDFKDRGRLQVSKIKIKMEIVENIVFGFLIPSLVTLYLNSFYSKYLAKMVS
jgi:hypothetical protein